MLYTFYMHHMYNLYTHYVHFIYMLHKRCTDYIYIYIIFSIKQLEKCWGSNWSCSKKCWGALGEHLASSAVSRKGSKNQTSY